MAQANCPSAVSPPQGLDTWLVQWVPHLSLPLSDSLGRTLSLTATRLLVLLRLGFFFLPHLPYPGDIFVTRDFSWAWYCCPRRLADDLFVVLLESGAIVVRQKRAIREGLLSRIHDLLDMESIFVNAQSVKDLVKRASHTVQAVRIGRCTQWYITWDWCRSRLMQTGSDADPGWSRVASTLSGFNGKKLAFD